MNQRQLLLAALVVILLSGLGYLYQISQTKPARLLPYFGPGAAMDSTIVSKAYFKVPDFSFVNQEKKTVTLADMKGKIWVADFIFSTCQGICPVMSKQLMRVNQAFADDANVLILSHTVDPDTDSPEVLKTYAQRHGADAPKWQFLTGDKAKIYWQARNGYFLDDSKPLPVAEDFVHTQNFALVDWNQHIRGYYDGTDSTDVTRLINEINLLKQEWALAQ